MKLRYSFFVTIILIAMMVGVFAAKAEDAKPQFVEEATALQAGPLSVTNPDETSALGYKISTSNDDPLCDTKYGGYINLEDQGILATARVPSGDNFAIGPFFTGGGSIEFYGRQNEGLWLTDDGFVIFDSANYGNRPWEPQLIPQVGGPNGLAALLWQNMQIVYDKEANYGVSLGASMDGSIIVVEFDNVRLANSPNDSYDVEMVMRRQVNNTPGVYEIVFAYDNLHGTLAGPLTIGVENAAGDSGVALVNRGSAAQVISDGLMVCFDAAYGSPPSATPSSIQASDGTYEDKVHVTWDDVSEAAHYDVYRADVNGNSEIKLGTASEPLFDDIYASAGITYTYRVKACNEYGCSNPSDHDSGWRAGDDPPPPPPVYDNIYYIPVAVTK